MSQSFRHTRPDTSTWQAGAMGTLCCHAMPGHIMPCNHTSASRDAPLCPNIYYVRTVHRQDGPQLMRRPSSVSRLRDIGSYMVTHMASHSRETLWPFHLSTLSTNVFPRWCRLQLRSEPLSLVPGALLRDLNRLSRHPFPAIHRLLLTLPTSPDSSRQAD